jgi:hypothetical protein
MRYLVLSFPRLSVQLARKAETALAGRAFALVRGEGDGALLSCVSVEATADGVEAGMTSLQARQRCPGIDLAVERPERSLALLESVVDMIRARATPNVAIVSRNGIALELCGLERQFVDEVTAATALLGLVRSRTGLDVRCGVASSIEEASCAARTARRFPVVCAERDAAPQALTRFEPVSAWFRWEAPASAAVAGERLGRLAASLDTAAQEYGQSYREVLVELECGPYRRAFSLRPEAPIHTGGEALALIRGRIASGEFEGVTVLRMTLSRPGPDVRVQPWRAPVATIHQLSGPAVAVQRRLLRAS